MPNKDAIASQMSDFVEAIRKGRAPRVPGTDALEVMRVAWQIHATHKGKGPGPEDLLRLATLGGAAALGFNDIGSLEPGKAADFQVLDWNEIVPAGAPPAESAHDLVSRILHRGGRSAIREVYVAGRRVFDGSR